LVSERVGIVLGVVSADSDIIEAIVEDGAHCCEPAAVALMGSTSLITRRTSPLCAVRG
tara:strand:+ start:126 stop:299 length:174 start_codon:yes stop_codon:yes gene_type:complete